MTDLKFLSGYPESIILQVQNLIEKDKLGDLFEADMHGLIVNGKVVGVFPSQLGGVTVYVQDTDV